MKILRCCNRVRSRTCREDRETNLVIASKLKVDLEVLLVESLQQGVQHSTQERTVNLLDDLCSRFPRISPGRDRSELELIQVVVLRVLVRGSNDERDEVEREVQGSEDGGEEQTVVVYAAVDEGDGSLEVVEESMNVCRCR